MGLVESNGSLRHVRAVCLVVAEEVGEKKSEGDREWFLSSLKQLIGYGPAT